MSHGDIEATVKRLLKVPDQAFSEIVVTLDGNARAFLSDRYRRLDNYDLLAHVYPMLRELPGARVESCEVTDSRMYLKVVTSRVQFELAPGNIVHAGVVISNAETGQGSLSVSPLIFRLLCSNGLIAADLSLKKTHVGRALGSVGRHKRLRPPMNA